MRGICSQIVRWSFFAAWSLNVISTSALAEAPIVAMALSPDQTQILVGSQAGVKLYSWPDLLPRDDFPTELKSVHDIQFHPNGSQLLIAGGSPAEYGAVEVMDWPKVQRIRRLRLHDDLVYRVAWHTAGKHWATASGDGRCQVVSSESGEILATYSGHSRGVLSVVSLPDTNFYLSVGIDQTLRIWNSQDAGHQRTLDNHLAIVNGSIVLNTTKKAGLNEDAPQKIESSSVSMRAVTWSEDRTLRLWNPLQGRMVRIARLSSTPRALVWSQNRNLLVVGCNDGTLHTFDTDDLGEIGTGEGNVGRIHELIVDDARGLIGIGGEYGMRVMALSEIVRREPERSLP